MLVNLEFIYIRIADQLKGQNTLKRKSLNPSGEPQLTLTNADNLSTSSTYPCSERSDKCGIAILVF